MSMNTLLYEEVNGIKIIKLNKPKKKNAIDYNMYTEMIKELQSAALNEKITAVVFTGTGDFYSSGNDLSAKNENVDRAVVLDAVTNFIKTIITFPKLLIAIVNGPAVGVAVTTLPLFDFVYASEKAYFYTPFTKLGIVAEGCSTITFPQLMGPRKARQMLMLNYRMSAQEAFECGLVTYVFKQEELEAKSWEHINSLLMFPEDSLITTKKLFRRADIGKLLEVNEAEMTEVKRLAMSRL